MNRITVSIQALVFGVVIDAMMLESSFTGIITSAPAVAPYFNGLSKKPNA